MQIIETSETKDRGYMGNPSRGASLGRSSKIDVPDNEAPVKVHLRGIRLDAGGYDPGGAYWGHGGYLWEAWTDDGAFYATGRAYVGGRVARRDAAKREVRELLPNARFFR